MSEAGDAGPKVRPLASFPVSLVPVSNSRVARVFS